MNRKRTLVIGDVHSGYRALKQVLDRVGLQPSDHLVFLGDYVDGWSEAVETVDFLMELNASRHCTLIRGNHDALCYDWLTTWKDNPLWFQHGGEATMDSYLNVDERLRKRHIRFFEELVDYHIDSQERLFLHAGFTNLKGVDHEYFHQTFFWDRTLWELARSLNPDLSSEDPDYPRRLTHYPEIFIGHTPLTKTGLAKPQKAANVWNMDTGAAFKGPLSVMDVDTKEVWQSDPVHTFYPKERGRN